MRMQEGRLAGGEVTVKKPGFPISGELHRLSAASRAVITAKVRSAGNATIPPRSLAGASMPVSRSASARTPAPPDVG
jgi:hypothetical protein